MIPLILLYVLPLILCVYRGKVKKDRIIAKWGFIPIFNILVTMYELQEMFDEWIEK